MVLESAFGQGVIATTACFVLNAVDQTAVLIPVIVATFIVLHPRIGHALPIRSRPAMLIVIIANPT